MVVKGKCIYHMTMVICYHKNMSALVFNCVYLTKNYTISHYLYRKLDKKHVRTIHSPQHN